MGHVTKYVCLVMNQVVSCIFFKSHHITLPCRLPPNQWLPLPSLRDVGTTSSPTIAFAHVIVQNPARSRETHMLPHCFPSFLQHRQWDGMETTCLLVYPSRDIEDEAVWHWRQGGVESTCCLVSSLSWGIEDEAAWSPHATSFPLFSGALKTRWCGAHMPPRFPFFSGALKMRRYGAASFPFFTTSSKTRRRGAHTPPRFPSSLWHRGRGGMEPTCHLVSPLHHGIEDKAAWNPHATLFLFLPAASTLSQLLSLFFACI